jgi:hypothetical protein
VWRNAHSNRNDLDVLWNGFDARGSFGAEVHVPGFQAAVETLNRTSEFAENDSDPVQYQAVVATRTGALLSRCELQMGGGNDCSYWWIGADQHVHSVAFPRDRAFSPAFGHAVATVAAADGSALVVFGEREHYVTLRFDSAFEFADSRLFGILQISSSGEIESAQSTAIKIDSPDFLVGTHHGSPVVWTARERSLRSLAPRSVVAAVNIDLTGAPLQACPVGMRSDDQDVDTVWVENSSVSADVLFAELAIRDGRACVRRLAPIGGASIASPTPSGEFVLHSYTCRVTTSEHHDD